MAPLLALSAFTGKAWEAEAKPSWALARKWVAGQRGSVEEGYREKGYGSTPTVGHSSGTGLIINLVVHSLREELG